MPTISEAAGANLLLSTSYSLHAKSGTPPEILAKLHAAVEKVLADPDIQASATKRGLKAYATTPAELDRTINADAAVVGKLIRDHNIKVQ